MKLIQCVSLTSNNLRMQCVECHKWTDFNHLHADLDGKAFVDYYCDACAKSKEESR